MSYINIVFFTMSTLKYERIFRDNYVMAESLSVGSLDRLSKFLSAENHQDIL